MSLAKDFRGLSSEMRMAAAAAAALAVSLVLPGGMAGYKPTSASLNDGALVVGFEHG